MFHFKPVSFVHTISYSESKMLQKIFILENKQTVGSKAMTSLTSHITLTTNYTYNRSGHNQQAQSVFVQKKSPVVETPDSL